MRKKTEFQHPPEGATVSLRPSLLRLSPGRPQTAVLYVVRREDADVPVQGPEVAELGQYSEIFGWEADHECALETWWINMWSCGLIKITKSYFIFKHHVSNATHLEGVSHSGPFGFHKPPQWTPFFRLNLHQAKRDGRPRYFLL